jgi:hypothetical protein
LGRFSICSNKAFAFFFEPKGVRSISWETSERK